MKRKLIKILTRTAVVFSVLVAVFIVLVVWPLPTPAPLIQASGPVAITNVSIINPGDNALLSGQTVLIEKGRIKKVGSNDLFIIPQNAERIDGNGKFLIPGLWDMHAHMGSELAPQLTLPLFIAAGVTNIRDLGGYASLEQKKDWNKQAIAGNIIGPRIMGQASVFVFSLETETEARKLVDNFVVGNGDFFKVYNGVLPDPYFALLKEANAKGIPVLGHKPRAVSAIDAANYGHKSFEHARLFLFECYPGAQKLRERYLARYTGVDTLNGSIETTAMRREMIDNHDPKLFNELAAVMVENSTWFCPTHITRKMDAFADNEEYRQDMRLKYIPFLKKLEWKMDANGMIDRDSSPRGRKAFMDFYLKGLELTGKAHDAGLKILAGTDANDTYCFPGLGIHDELQELVKAGLTPMEALKTATVNPAAYFDLSANYGSLAEGKVADMVLLDANPLDDISNTSKINAVIFNGNIYPRKKLDNLLEYVEKNASNLSIACKLLWKDLSD